MTASSALLHARLSFHDEAELVARLVDVDGHSDLSCFRVGMASVDAEPIRAADKHAAHRALCRRAIAPMNGGVEEAAINGFKIGEARHRSEEHTSELQSHSFISYAVF